jgi:hypothetical protein
LLDVSECEQTIVCGLEKEVTWAKVSDLLSRPEVTAKDSQRLIALFAIRCGREVERNLDHICRAIKGGLREVLS